MQSTKGSRSFLLCQLRGSRLNSGESLIREWFPNFYLKFEVSLTITATIYFKLRKNNRFRVFSLNEVSETFTVLNNIFKMKGGNGKRYRSVPECQSI